MSALKETKRLRKVYHAYYPGNKDPHPVIRIAGKYLSGIEFDIGDMVEVVMEPGRIVITKVLPRIANSKSFGPAIKEFILTVPEDYIHHRQLEQFFERNDSHFHFHHPGITDQNFANVTNCLTPGRTYKVKIFPVYGVVSSEECIDFLQFQNAILVGAQGLSVLWEVARNEIPRSKRLVSFDERISLWQDDEDMHWLPEIQRMFNGKWEFDLGSFQFPCTAQYRLLCFCEL
jgi:hypothetical protein